MRVTKQTHRVSHAAGPMRLFALVLCLLLSQALGLIHGIKHVPHSHHHNHQHSTHFEAIASDTHPSWIADLFAGHSDVSTCQVFDQLSHGSALLGQAIDIGYLTFTSFFLDTYRGVAPAYQRSLIQARGPPVVSAVV